MLLHCLLFRWWCRLCWHVFVEMHVQLAVSCVFMLLCRTFASVWSPRQDAIFNRVVCGGVVVVFIITVIIIIIIIIIISTLMMMMMIVTVIIIIFLHHHHHHYHHHYCYYCFCYRQHHHCYVCVSAAAAATTTTTTTSTVTITLVIIDCSWHLVSHHHPSVKGAGVVTCQQDLAVSMRACEQENNFWWL